MKPSEPKCGSDHDIFVLKMTDMLREPELHGFTAVEFEKPLYNKNQYIGSVDLFLAKTEKKNAGNKEFLLYKDILVIDFKPNLDKITDAVRQLKVYASIIGKETRIAISSYSDEITEDKKKICAALGAEIIPITRNGKGPQTKLSL